MEGGNREKDLETQRKYIMYKKDGTAAVSDSPEVWHTYSGLAVGAKEDEGSRTFVSA